MSSAETVPQFFFRRNIKWAFCSLIVLFLSFNKSYGQASFSISTCSGTPFNFIQPNAVNGTTYTWAAPVISPVIAPPGAITGGSAQASAQSSVSEVLVNTTTSQATATYVVTPSSGLPFQLIVTVNPLPVLNSTLTPAAICSNTSFSYNPTSATSGTSFSWSRLAVTGISNAGNQGGGNPNEILFNTTVNPIAVQYSYTLTANGCSVSNQNVTVTVNPIPFLTSTQAPTPICSGTFFDYTATSNNTSTFSWTRNGPANINNNSTTSGNTAVVHEQLVNTTLLPITVTYAFTLTNSQSCPSNQQLVRVVVNPIPNVTNQTVNPLCSGNTFISSPNTVLGTLYTWTTPTMVTSGSISGGSSVSVGQLYIGQALTNNGASNETIRYQVTPNAFGCVGSTFNVDVTVNTTTNSTAVISNPTPSGICSGANFVYAPQSSTGISYTWQRFYNTSITQGPTNGSSPNNLINEQLTNASIVPTVVYYAITFTTPNGCNNTTTVPVSVNPPTTLASTLTPVPICSGSLFSYNPLSATPGTAFAWTRAVVAGISNSAGSGTNDPQETLINVTTSPISVVYKYSLGTPNGCVNTQNVTVTVNPSPSLTSSLNPPAICSGTVFNYVHTSNTGSTFFSWTRAVIPNISNGAGNGTSNPSELLVNSSVIPVSVPYVYTLFANGCSNTQTVTVIVNPTPVIFNQTIPVCSNTPLSITPSNTPVGTTYTWGNPVITPNNSISGATSQVTGVGTISQQLVNQTLNQATATYTISPVSATCVGASAVISVTVNPVPVIANQQVAPICSGTSFSYTAAVVPTGTTYTWSSPVQSPFNTISGASAQPLIQTTISQTLSTSNNLTDTATYFVTPSTSGCAGNIFTLLVPVKPVPVINNIIDTICTGSSFSISPTPVPANTTYTWPTPVSTPFGAVVGGSAQTTGASTLSQILVNATTSPAQLVYTITPSSAGCVGANFKLTEVVGNALPAFANKTALICSGTAFDVTPVAPANTTYTWTIPTVTPAGSIVGVSAKTTPQTVISQTLTNITTVTDTAVYTILPSNTGCKGNTFTATVRVLPLPVATITGNNPICRYPVDTLSISFTGTAPWSFTYTDYNVVKTITGVASSPYKWTVPITPGVNTRTLAISPVKDFACTNTDTSYFVQTINPLPVGIINSIHGVYICNNIVDTLFVSSADSVGYQWTFNGTPIPGINTDSIGTLNGGSYNAILTNKYGCIDTAAAPVLLTYIAQPVLKFMYDSYCINNPILFTNLTDTNFIGLTKWTWDFGDSTTASTYSATHTYPHAGDRHIRLTANQLFCPAYATTLDTTINIQFPIAAVRLPSVSAYLGQFTPLTARVIPGYRYQWTPSRGIDNPDSALVNFNYQNSQEYIIDLISPAGCVTPDTMMVRVFNDKLIDIFVPKSFTPNGDGVNDILYPYLTGIQTFQFFKVYNRFGKLMFETTNYDIGWNGTLNGTPQPMGIYIWVSQGIATDGSLVVRKGETLLLR